MAFIVMGVNGQIDRSKRPESGPAPEVQVGHPESFTLDNGLTVMVVENHKLPRVNIALRLDNPIYTEGSKKGVSDLTGELLGNGTKTIAKDDFQEEVDFMGARISYSSLRGQANMLSRYFSRVLELFADGFINPKFSEEDFQRDVDRMTDNLKAAEKDVKTNARRVENVLTFGAHHPKGEYITIENLEKLSLQDVKDHYASYYVPNNAYLIIVGDVDFAEVQQQVKKYFSNWEKGTLPTSDFEAPEDFKETEIDFVDIPNAVQSEVAILNPTHLKMTDPDFYPAIVANQIYGGDFNSYLNMSLREDHGWTYGARSSLTADKEIGKARGGAAVRNVVTDSAVVEALKQLKKLRTTKPDEEVLERVKAGMIGSFVMNIENPQTVANLAYQSQTQNLPDDFYENYVKNINAVTPEQVQEAAQQYFSYDHAKILVVGKASEVLEGLKNLPYAINYYDRFGNPTSEPEEKTVGADVSVQSVMEDYIAAIGGEDKVENVKTLTEEYEAEAQGMKLNMKSIKTADGKMIVEVSMMGNTVSKTVFDGEKGYVMAQGQKQDMDEDLIEEMKVNAFPFPELQWAQKEGVKISGIENFNDKDAYVIEDGDVKIYYDIESGLKLGTRTTVEVQGQEMAQTITLDDYEEYDGLLFPTVMTQDVGMKMEFKITDVKLNEEYEDTDFQ